MQFVTRQKEILLLAGEKNGQTEACLIMSGKDQDALFDDYSDFFEPHWGAKGEKGIQLIKGVTKEQLWRKFCLSLSLSVLKVFDDEVLRDFFAA